MALQCQGEVRGTVVSMVSTQDQGLFISSWEMWIMTPNCYGALVSTPPSDSPRRSVGGLCSLERRRRAASRATRGNTTNEASEIDGAVGSLSQSMLEPQT